MFENTFRRLIVLALAAGLLSALGCAQQVGDIDRTQANALEKADFTEGEWYIRQTFSEVPPASYSGFIGETGATEKIRWEITEDYLIAYRSYEHNPGARRAEAYIDENGELQYREGEEEGYSDEYKESPIAAYPISSHFDIQRSYNSSTGEQTNVIVENSSDRLWWERSHFRVNWENALTTELLFDNYFTTGISFYVQESEENGDSFRMEYWDPNLNIPSINADDYEEGDLYYMDFTNRLLLDPGYSYCWNLWYPFSLDDCAASEVEIRTSIQRVPAYSEYEPIYYDDIDQQKFGYFRVERLAYDDRYGERLSGRVLLPQRHNIWSNTWQRDAEGNILRDAEGHMVPNSFANRTLKPVVYHVSPNFPEDLWGAALQIGQDWNLPLRRSVAAAQQVPLDTVRDMFYVCHNPVIQEDPIECGDVGLTVRVGDLRYNVLYWVDAPQAAGPLGYGPSAPDPETGEIISGTAYIFGASVDTYTQYALDLIRFFNGDLDIAAIEDASYIRDEIARRSDPDVDPRSLMNIDIESVNTERLVSDMNVRDVIPEAGRQFLDHVDQHGMNDFAARPEWFEHRFDMIAESGAGALAVDDEVLRGFGVSSLSQLPDDIRDAYFRGGALVPRIITEGRDRRMEAARNNIYLAENLDQTVVGIAMEFAGRTDYDNMWNELRSVIFRAVATHEVGHTLGLRHNFQGSYDALNYHDEYWEMKTAGIFGVTNSGSVDVVPFDRPEYLVDVYGIAQMTPAQVAGRMREYQYTSIMDYSSGFNTDLHGLGKYDEAAIIYAYTSGRDNTVTLDPADPFYNTQQRGYVEVFNNVGNARSIFESVEGDDNPAYWDLLELYHYSTVVTEMANDGGGYQAGEAGAQLIQQRLQDRSVMRWQDVVNQREAGVPGHPIEVPYMFLSDYWAGASQSARVWDQGADPLEQAINLIERYRTYYPFTYFRRERLMWDTSDIFDSLVSYYFIDMVDNYQRWLFDVAIQDNRPDPVLDNGWTFGAFASLNMLAEVMTTPSYGSYELDQADNTYYLTSYSERSDADLYIPQGEGRRPYSRYDADLGYNYWVFPNEAGHFWAYYAANLVMSAMTSLSVRGADVDADFLTYSIPVYLVFEDEMTNLYNGLWLQDNSSIAPVVVRNGDGKMHAERRLFTAVEFTDGTMMDPETGQDVSYLMDTSDSGQNVGPSVDVMQGFTYRYLPLLYGMAFFDSNFSLHYADQNRVFRLGSGETLEPGPGFDVVEVCDPISIGGVCYAALSETGSDDPGAAVRLITQTQELVEDYENGDTSIAYEIENNIELMNMMRGLYDLYANPWD